MFEGRKYRYWARCDSAPDVFFQDGDQAEPYLSPWDEMCETSKPISYDTLLKHVPVEHLWSVFRFALYDWGNQRTGGNFMRNDWHVGYWKGKLRKEPVYYVTHSGWEFVFTRRGRVP